ncbi:MAG: hypothetical protein ACQEVA_04275 [Myxococcota bacterium]
MNDRTFSWWSAFRTFCLLTGLTLIGLAYFAPEQLEPYMGVDLAWTLGFILLLLLPISMVIRFGAKRMFGSIRRSGRRASMEEARTSLPDWANARGLSFEPSPQHGEVGEALGEYRGFKLLYDPDAGDVSVRWRQPVADEPLDLSTTPPPVTGPGAAEAFDTDDTRFDAIFQTRLAGPAVADQIRESASIRDTLCDFWEAHDDVLEELNVDAQGVVCFLGPDSHYDLEVASRLVDAQIDLMESLEQQFA